MKLIQVGQNVTVTFEDGSKLSKKFTDKEERVKVTEEIKAFQKSFNDAKSDKTKNLAIKKVKALLEVNTQTVKAKEEDKKAAVKKVKQKIEKEVKQKKEKLPSVENLKTLQQYDLENKELKKELEELKQKLNANETKLEAVEAPEPKRYTGEGGFRG